MFKHRQRPSSFRRWLRRARKILYRLFEIGWVQHVIRLGHAAKGFLYGLIGLLALRAVFYDNHSAGGSESVLIALEERATGGFLLAFLAIGLAGYTFWRLVQAFIDPEQPEEEVGIRRFVHRCGYCASGLAYLSVGYTAGRLAIGITVDFEDTAEEIVEVLFQTPLGPWVLGSGGCAVILVGVIYVYGALSGSFINEFQPGLYSAVKRTTVLMGQIGFTARGGSFILIGAYLLQSAYYVNDETAGGLGQVLDRLDDQPNGKIWLTAIALGFLAYAAYMMMAALYRRFPDGYQVGNRRL